MDQIVIGIAIGVVLVVVVAILVFRWGMNTALSGGHYKEWKDYEKNRKREGRDA